MQLSFKKILFSFFGIIISSHISFGAEENIKKNLIQCGQNSHSHLAMMGDSITQFFQEKYPTFFTPGRINLGISGQTTSQMILRFEEQITQCNPKIVHILGGTNDIAENSGPYNSEKTLENIKQMVQIAKKQSRKVILGLVPPAASFYWRPEVTHALEKINELNQQIIKLANRENSEEVLIIDYFNLLYDGETGMKTEFTLGGGDLVHPNALAYKIMAEKLESVLQKMNESKN